MSEVNNLVIDQCNCVFWDSLLFRLSSQLFTFQVMNGLILSHNVKDHTNGSAPLRSLPVSTWPSLSLTLINMTLIKFDEMLNLGWWSRFQHWSRMVFCRPWQLEGTSLSLKVTHSYSNTVFHLSHSLPTGVCGCILDTRRVLKIQFPLGVQVACTENAGGLRGSVQCRLLNRKD